MSNVRYLSFSGGEITPALYGRVDQVKYQTGLKTCRNFFVMRHGGVANRSGTQFIAEVKDSTKKVKLVPFVFNAAQTYVLEFGNLYQRVYKNGVQATETTKNITAATQAAPCVITIGTHGYTNGQEVYITGVAGMTQINGRNFKVANKTTNTFEITDMAGTAIDSTLYGAYTSGGTAARVYEIVTPYVEAALPALQYVQSADIVTITNSGYAPRDLSRTGDTSWTLSTITFGATITAPTGLASDAAGTSFYYKVTAVSAETNEESMPSSSAGSSTKTSTLTWTAVSGAGYYNIYRLNNSQWGWIGVAGTDATPTFTDANYTPDALDTPPVDRQPFTGAGNYPSAVTYYQQRKIFANTDNNPEGVYTSKSALRKNFMISTPLQADDAVTFSLAGRQVNAVKHMIDIGKLIVFTSGGEWSIEGDAAGVLAPGEINPKQYTSNGLGTLPPIEVGGSALYIQARGSIVRDLAYDYQTDGYRGSELSIFAAHLFEGYTIVDWAYQQIPHSIVWAVRSDGVLLGLTYIREHQVFGWHRHEFDGQVENVCVVPEGTEDVLYLVIKRTINGATKRYIERMHTRQISDIVDAVFLDSSLTYDGRNTGATTMTLSGGTNWTHEETLTLTASASFFVSGDVGNAIFLNGSDGTQIRFTVIGYTGVTVVTGKAHKTVPAGMRSVAISDWSKAVDEVSGLSHLEGKAVSIFADGFVVANPNNPDYVERTVTSGAVTLDKPYSVIHVGLPITADLQTLNIDTVQGQSLADKKKHVSKLTVHVESSRGLWAGPDADGLTELKMRSDEDYDSPIELETGTVELNIEPSWSSTGSVLIRQIDPLPLSILAVIPAGYIAVG